MCKKVLLSSNISMFPQSIQKWHEILVKVQTVWPLWSSQHWPLTLDISLKDRSLCLIRALPYYMDRTKDLRDNKQVVLSLSGRILTYYPLQFLLGSNRQFSCVLNFRTRKHFKFAKAKSIMLGLLLPLKTFKEESF